MQKNIEGAGVPRRPFPRVLLKIKVAGSALAIFALASGILAGIAAQGASATTLTPLVSNDFEGDSTPAGAWVLPTGSNQACLTAGPADSSSSVRNCSPTTDSNGSGALRLTTAGGSQVGAVFNTTSLPFSEGLDIEFDTYQFDSSSRADGISFALSAADPADPTPPASPGPVGGSLGYSTDQTDPGLPYGYLGFGFDVYGNYLNESYGGTTCGAFGDFGSATYPQNVTVRGPGEGTSGYCILATSGNTSSTSSSNNLQDGAATLDGSTDTTHNSSDMVPVEVAINPSSSSSTDQSGDTVPADSFLVAFTPVGGARKTITGALPDLDSTYSSLGFPSSWVNPSTGYPYQVTFGWTASTGGSTEYHEVNTLTSETLNGPLPTLSLSDTDSTSGVFMEGTDTTTVTLTPSVSTANEAYAPTVTDTFPTGVVPDLSSSNFGGTSWDCSASSGQTVSCTWTGGTVDAGSSFNSISVPVSVTSSATEGAGNDSAKVSSDDALAAVAQDNFTVEKLPSAPASVSGSAKDSSVQLSWTAPSDNGDSAITGYVVTPYIGGTAQAPQTFGSTNTTETVTSLTPGTAYTFKVAAINGVGTGPNTSASGSITPNSGPTITTLSLPGDDTGVVYSQGISATGGTGSYTWSVSAGNLPAGLSLNASTGLISGTPTTIGTYTFTLGLTDQGGGSTSQQYTVVISNPPDITTTSLPGGDVNQSYSQSVSATGGTGALTWSILSGHLPPGLSQSSSSGSISGTPSQAGTYTFTVEATDQVGETATKAYTVTVASPVGITPASLPGDDVNVAYSQTLAATNGTGPYTWSVSAGSLPLGLLLSSDGQVTGTPTSVGLYTFTAEVTDAAGQTATQQYTVEVSSAPSVTPASLPGGEENVSYSQSLTANAGTGPYTWSVSAGSLPPGLSLGSSSGQITGAPTAFGSYSFTVTLTDSDGQTAVQAYTVTVQAPPYVTTPSLDNGEVNVPYSDTLTATAGTAPYSWSIGAGTLPAGLSLDPTTGVISGTPTSDGNYNVTVTVTDSLGQSESRPYSLSVLATPSVTTASFPGTEVGAFYSQPASATGGTAPYTWSLASGSIPPGLSIDPSTGTISGTASAAGSYTFALQVTDNKGQSATSPSYTVNVTPGSSISPSTLPGGELNVPYSENLTGSGGTGPYTWSLDGNSALPAGISLGPFTGAITGTPSGPSVVGTDDFTVDLSDANGVTVSRSYVITVAADPTITTGATLPGAEPSTSYSEALSVSGGTGPYTWLLGTASQLPAGLRLATASGAITGTPSTPGTYSFAVNVTDALGQKDIRTFTLTVSQATVPPLSVVPSASTTLSITAPSSSANGSASSTTAQVGSDYSETLGVSGGTGPYSWSLTSGNLPPGLTLDASSGVISGVPAGQGTYTFMVTVIDGEGHSESELMTIAIGGAVASTGQSNSVHLTVGNAYPGSLPGPSGGKAPYRWEVGSGALPPGLKLDGATGAITGTATTPGTYRLTLEVTNSEGHVYFESLIILVSRGVRAGYRLVGSDGGVFDFKTPFHGSCELNGSRCEKLNRHAGAIASTPDGRGYWLVAADGGVFTFGDARFYGSCEQSTHPCGEVVGSVVAIAPTPDGRGYWLVAANGAVYRFGDAASYGSCTSADHPCGKLSSPVVGIAASASGGYWLATAKGDVLGFGKGAPVLGTCLVKGSRCGQLDASVVGITSTPGGHGYWLVAADGGVFAFGNARFYGNTRTANIESQLVGPIVGMARTPNGRGYWLAASDGGVFAFGEARFWGNTRTAHVEEKLVGKVMGIAYSSEP